MGVLYSLYDALVSINVSNEKARAVVDAMEQDMLAQLVNRSEFRADMQLIRQELNSTRELMSKDMLALRADTAHGMERLESRLTIKLGSIAIVLTGVLFAMLKLA